MPQDNTGFNEDSLRRRLLHKLMSNIPKGLVVQRYEYVPGTDQIIAIFNVDELAQWEPRKPCKRD